MTEDRGMHETLTTLLQQIEPLDTLESEHLTDTLEWIASGVPLWRMAKPASPPKHLVSYFVLLDSNQEQMLLVDHKLAGLWLPSGGHVEPGEHPTDTVIREVREELTIEAAFLFDAPLFLTVTQTVGQTAGHTDVSLWYILHGNAGQQYEYDKAEFRNVAWFPLSALPLHRADPHLQRFARKLKHALKW